MTRTSQGSVPASDPSALTEDRIERANKSERDYVDGQIEVLVERLGAIDRATRLLNDTVNRVPTDVQVAIQNLREIQDERFKSIEQQFRERDTRSERESRDNKVAVDAAFAAQKEAASEQNKSNTLAINKSEIATNETINKLAELFRTTTDGLKDNMDDLKGRILQVEAEARTRGTVKHEGQASIGQIAAIVGAIVLVVNLVIAFVLAGPGSP